jgi:glycosyltransferase involved in cell wall biosynthesis
VPALVFPVFNEELNFVGNLRVIHDCLSEMPRHRFRILNVDDGSSDKTLHPFSINRIRATI